MDTDGKVTTINRDGDGVAQTIVAPGGQTTRLTIDSQGHLTALADPAGNVRQFSYSEDGLLLTQTDPGGNISRYGYDDQGLVTSDQDAAGGKVTLARTGNKVTETTALGRHLSIEVQPRSDGSTRIVRTDATGSELVAVRSANFATTTVNRPDGSGYTMTYGPDPRWGMLAPIPVSGREVQPSGNTSFFDFQRSVTLSDPGDKLSLANQTDVGTFNGRTFTQTYDRSTRRLTQTTPEGHTSVTQLDALGRATSLQADPSLLATLLAYNARGFLQSSSNGPLSLVFGFDSSDRRVSETNSLGQVKRFVYDLADRVTGLVLPGGSPVNVSYDANGNIVRVVPPDGSAHTLTYSPINDLASLTVPGGATCSFRTDLDSQPLQDTLPSGRTRTYRYDVGGRMSRIVYPEATRSFAYADTTRRVAVATWTPVSGTPQLQERLYDGGFVTDELFSGPADGTLSYTYNADGRTDSVSVDGVTRYAGYDNDGNVTSFGPFTLARGGPAGSLSGITDGTFSQSFAYDTIGRLARITCGTGAGTFYDLQLDYGSGRLTRRTETVNGVAHVYDYSYDGDGQLVAVTRDSAAYEAYSYDARGNRLSTLAETATYDAQDRLLTRGASTYQVSNDGFLAGKDGDTFQYSAFGELLSATVGGQTVTYGYTGAGRLASRTQGAATTGFLSGVASKDGSGTTVYYYDDRQHLFAFERGGSLYYVGCDQVGTPRIVVDSAGIVQKVIDRDSFGVLASDSNPGFVLPIGFAGGIEDPLTGLVRFGARDYEPASGRFCARDPILFAGGDFNLYRYGFNDPVNNVDPSGFGQEGAGTVPAVSSLLPAPYQGLPLVPSPTPQISGAGSLQLQGTVGHPNEVCYTFALGWEGGGLGQYFNRARAQNSLGKKRGQGRSSPKPGDVGVIYDPRGNPEHAFRYLGNCQGREYVLQRNGESGLFVQPLDQLNQPLSKGGFVDPGDVVEYFSPSQLGAMR